MTQYRYMSDIDNGGHREMDAIYGMQVGHLQ